jgi:hypothetical protein
MIALCGILSIGIVTDYQVHTIQIFFHTFPRSGKNNSEYTHIYSRLRYNDHVSSQNSKRKKEVILVYVKRDTGSTEKYGGHTQYESSFIRT